MLKTVMKRTLKVLLVTLTACGLVAVYFLVIDEGGELPIVSLGLVLICMLITSVIYYIATGKFNPYSVFKKENSK